MSIKDSLRRLNLFAGLSNEAYESVLKRLTGNAKEKTLDRGEVLYSPGEYCEHMIIVLQGTVKSIWYSESGEEISSEYFKDTSTRILLCIPCIFPVPLRSYYITAVRSCLLFIPREDMLLAMDEVPAFKDQIIQHLCHISERRLSHLYIIQHKRAAHRICSYLLEEYSFQGTLTIDNFYSFEALANHLNLTRPAFSRELHALERAGVLTIQRKSITINSLEKLHEQMGPKNAAPLAPAD